MARRRIPLRDLIAAGPSLSRAARRALDDPPPSGVAYAGEATFPAPVPPVQVFGVAYDLDLVLVTDHPSWDMHELARVLTPDGPVWLCKDSRAGSLEQTIVADVDGLGGWLPEVPLARHPGPVQVDDRSCGEDLDLLVRYTNPAGERVDVVYQGPAPAGPVGRRNSSTMGHSRDHVLAVLDLSHRALARRVRVCFDGVERPARRILGVVPFGVALVQTQAGFSVGAWTARPTAQGLRTVHATGVAQDWRVEVDGPTTTLVQDGPLRTLRYVHRDGELVRAEVWPFGRPVPACVAAFSPALPDLRRPWCGVFRGRYALDVNGQPGHGDGEVVIERADGVDRVRLLPRAPRWTRDRPLVAEVRVGPDEARVDVRRSAP